MASGDEGITRRRALVGAAGLGGAAFLSACGLPGSGSKTVSTSTAKRLDYTLKATQREVLVGTANEKTWAYGSTIPGQEVRLITGGSSSRIAY